MILIDILGYATGVVLLILGGMGFHYETKEWREGIRRDTKTYLAVGVVITSLIVGGLLLVFGPTLREARGSVVGGVVAPPGVNNVIKPLTETEISTAPEEGAQGEIKRDTPAYAPPALRDWEGEARAAEERGGAA